MFTQGLKVRSCPLEVTVVRDAGGAVLHIKDAKNDAIPWHLRPVLIPSSSDQYRRLLFKPLGIENCILIYVVYVSVHATYTQKYCFPSLLALGITTIDQTPALHASNAQEQS